MSDQSVNFLNENSSISERNQEVPFEDIGTSMSAISLGFVATAILVSMFLIMAIFEHLLRPSTTYEQSQIENRRAPRQIHRRWNHPSVEKINGPNIVPMNSKMNSFSVLMPGQPCPTYLALPSPLVPCPREGMNWPQHQYPTFTSS